MNGQRLTAWVRFLEHTLKNDPSFSVDEEALQEWMAEFTRAGCVATVPWTLLREAVAPTDPSIASLLRSAFLRDRTGNAAVRQRQEAFEAAVMMEGNTGGGAYGHAEEDVAESTAERPRALFGMDDVDVLVPIPVVPATIGSTSEHCADPANLVALMRGTAGLVHAAGGRHVKPMNENNPMLLVLAFPTVFPFGDGGRRPEQVSNAALAEHLVRRVPRQQFGGNHLLLARLYDMQLREEIVRSAHITARVAPRDVATAGELPVDVVRAMADVLALPFGDAHREALLARGSPLVRALVTTVRQTAGRVDLTDAFYQGCRHKLQAVNLALGPPTFFFNLNPADMHSAAAVIASGEVLHFGTDGRPNANPPRDVVKKWDWVKANPYCCQELLVCIKDAILSELLGFDPGAKEQRDPHCFAGRVWTVSVKVEQSGRLALHIHGVAHLATFCIERLKSLFDGPNCRALALANALVQMWLPSPFYDLTDATGT